MGAISVPAKAGDTYKVVLMDVEDYNRLAGRKLSIGSHGYAQMWNCPGVILLHRWIMNVPVGTRYRAIVDHINRDPLDCRRENLRIVSPSESNLNRRIPLRDLPLGVYRTPNGRYAAKIKRCRVQRNLGTYDTPEAAAVAVEVARAEADRDAFKSAPDLAA
jgi:hypothetical protein